MSKKHYTHYNNYADESYGHIEEEPKPITDGVFETDEEPIAEFKNEIVGMVECDKLNVRKGPGVENDIVCVINKGTKVEITNEPDEDWYEIYTVSGIEGFCMKKFIKIV